jgi:transcriptional regulator with XRE-family HTH domain
MRDRRVLFLLQQSEREVQWYMVSPLPPKGKETCLALELRRLHWSQQQLARASQLRPEIISRLVTGKVAMPYTETRKKILIALRQRAAELRMSPPNEVWLFPASGELVAYQERWQEVLVEYARQISWAIRLTHELEPLDLLHLRFELARREGEAALSGTREHWEKAADIVYYATQRAAQGEPEALQEAQTILSQAQLSWKEAIVAALAKYEVRSRQAGKEAEYEWQTIACSLQALQQRQRETGRPT